MIGVDVGGTFTDVVAVRDGRVQVTKVSSDPDDLHGAVLEGARRLGLAGSAVFNHASTQGLNAVLTRRLPKIGFLTTEGHRDMLDAGRCWRPFEDQLDPRWRRSFGDAARPLVPRYLRRGIEERTLANGEVLIPLDLVQARAQLELLKRCRVEGVAICLLHAYANDAHERRLAALAREVLGGIPVSVSSEVSPRAKEFSRAATTVVDVLMKLLYGDYAHRLDSGLRGLGFGGELNFADCTAALLPWREALRAPHRILFAGPAAGTASCRRLAAAIDEPQLICCDVGGTSTDVSLVVDGRSFVNDSFEIEHDLVISALSTELASVGAGGGSIVAVSSSGDLTVGPASAGAWPGPACYGRGGREPTVTDACLLMGILEPEGFAGGQLRLDAEAARAAFSALPSSVPLQRRVGQAWRIAVNNIAEEITNLLIRHGADARDFSLVAYGAAGPMLLPATLELLGVRRVIVPPHPGLFSALGLLAGDLVYGESRSRYVLFEPGAAPRIEAIFGAMEESLRRELGEHAQGARLSRSFDARLLGQTWETAFIPMPPGPVDAAAISAMIEAFHAEYARRNGRAFRELPVQGVVYRVQLVVPAEKFEFERLPAAVRGTSPRPARHRRLEQYADRPLEAAVYEREQLRAGHAFDGPAIVQEPLCTTLVPPAHSARIGAFGEIVIEASGTAR